VSITDQAPGGSSLQDRITEVLGRIPRGLLTNGQWRDAGVGGTFEVEHPATGEVVATPASATHEDAAARAQEGWTRISARSRSEILCTTFDLVQERAEDLSEDTSLQYIGAGNPWGALPPYSRPGNPPCRLLITPPRQGAERCPTTAGPMTVSLRAAV